jgi:glycine cleavage system aminomethyltransferase T
MLRNSQAGPNPYPGVKPEYSNWRDEMMAWQDTAVLFNQSYHMAELEVTGPDGRRLLSDLAVNSLANLAPDRAKQFVPVTPYGHVIGDVILYERRPDVFDLIGRAPALNWITYHAETGDYNVDLEFDQRTALRTDGKRKHYRFQIQGPNAMAIIEKMLGEKPEELGFFRVAPERIAGRDALALRHGMAGQPGWELYGPWEDYEAIYTAIVEAGEEFGMRLVGGRAYGANAIESGWIPSPLPAVYSGDELKAYREWLPGNGYEAMASIGGSFVSEDIEDYYFTPWDLNYGHLVKFDHDFIGRDALQRMADEGGHRTKVTLALEDDDVTEVLHSQLGPRESRGKYIEFPNAVYSMHPFDKVTADGETIGVSTWIAYSPSEGKLLTLAVVDSEYADPGTEVTFVWGEENGGTAKPTVERHVQMEISGIVSPAPYVAAVQQNYAPGSWRAGRV